MTTAANSINFRVGIVLTGSLGDVARACAVPTLLKRVISGCEVGWICDKRFSDLIREHPSVDRVFEFPRSVDFGWISNIRALREWRPHVVLDLQRIFKSGVLSMLSGAKLRVGFNRRNAKEFNWCFNNRRIREADELMLSKLDDYLEFVRAAANFLNKSGDTVERSATLLQADWIEPDFGVRKKQFEGYIPQELLGDRNYLAVVLGSSWQSKDWALEGYLELIKELMNDGSCSIALVGDARQQETARTIFNALADSGIGTAGLHNLAGRTGLLQLAAIMAHAKAAVGPDSGPGHLAAMFNVPYVALFGPTSSPRTAPHGSESLAVAAQTGCSPCYRRRCPGLDRACMRLISVQQVLVKLRPLI